jgi:hypothetical protein
MLLMSDLEIKYFTEGLNKMKITTKILGIGAILAIPMLGSSVSHAVVVCSAAGNRISFQN